MDTPQSLSRANLPEDIKTLLVQIEQKAQMPLVERPLEGELTFSRNPDLIPILSIAKEVVRVIRGNFYVIIRLDKNKIDGIHTLFNPPLPRDLGTKGVIPFLFPTEKSGKLDLRAYEASY